MTTTVTRKGQVTVPKKIRDAKNLAPGSQVEFALNAQGEIVLRKAGKQRSAARPGTNSSRRVARRTSNGELTILWRCSEATTDDTGGHQHPRGCSPFSTGQQSAAGRSGKAVKGRECRECRECREYRVKCRDGRDDRDDVTVVKDRVPEGYRSVDHKCRVPQGASHRGTSLCDNRANAHKCRHGTSHGLYDRHVVTSSRPSRYFQYDAYRH